MEGIVDYKKEAHENCGGDETVLYPDGMWIYDSLYMSKVISL